MRNINLATTKTVNSDIAFNYSDLDILTPSSNQTLQKNDDGSIYGVRYVVSAEPSTLRPVRAWTIQIETFLCDNVANITSEDILFVRLLNRKNQSISDHDYLLDSIMVRNHKIDVNGNNNGFNAMMAATLIMSQIDARKTPNLNQVLSRFSLE